MSIFDSFRKKYNIKPENNMPREVYGTPDSMRRVNDKYNVKPEQNRSQRVYGVPAPMDFDKVEETNGLVGSAHFEYEIDGLGHYEKTVLKGLTVGEEFNLGNHPVAKIKIIDIKTKTVTVKVTVTERNFLHPDSDTVVLKINNELELTPTFKPSQQYCLRLVDISFTEPQFYL